MFTVCNKEKIIDLNHAEKAVEISFLYLLPIVHKSTTNIFNTRRYNV